MKALGKYNNLGGKLEIGCASFGQIHEDARSEQTVLAGGVYIWFLRLVPN